MTIGHRPERRDVLPEERGAATFRGKHMDHTLRSEATTFAIAASGCLDDGIQSGLFTICDGKVDVHTGLDQGGGNHAA